MKKILKSRKAIQGLAMALALATSISGCSFRGSDDLTEKESTVYESVEETESEHSHENEEHNHEDDLVTPIPSPEVLPDEVPSDIIEEAERKKIVDESTTESATSKEEDTIQDENTVDVTQESYIVMFEGEELVVPNLSHQYNSGSYTKFSINQALKRAGFSSDYAYRAKLARFYGIKNYKGTSSQNILLLNYLRHPELYLNMDAVINNNQDNTQTDQTQTEQNNQSEDQNNNGNNNGNNNNGGGNGGGHDHEDDKGHECNYGSLIIEYSNVTDTTHTVTTYRVCNTCGKKMIISTNTVGHSYTWTTQGNKEIGKCACGHTTTKDKEHEHNWKTVNEIYVPLDNGKHRVDLEQQCQVVIDGKPCTETRIVPGNEVNCTYDEHGVCKCGNIKNHEHGNWVEVDTKLVKLADGLHHRVDSIQQCQVKLPDGTTCTYTRTVPGAEVSCNWTLDDHTRCECGNTHTHKINYSYKSETEEEGTCEICHNTFTRGHAADADLIRTVTTTIASSDVNGHRFVITVKCPTCNHKLASEQTDVQSHNPVSTGKSDIQYDSTGHWYNEGFKCSDCNYKLDDKKVDYETHEGHGKTSTTVWEAIKNLAAGIFKHNAITTSTCTCGWHDTNTVEEECDHLGSTCSHCGQSTTVHQHDEYVIDSKQLHDGSEYCIEYTYGCHDAGCESYRRTEKDKHTPKVRDEDNPYEQDGVVVVDQYCQTCGDYLGYVPVSGLSTGTTENTNTFVYSSADGNITLSEEFTGEVLTEGLDIELGEGYIPDSETFTSEPIVTDEDQLEETLEEAEEEEEYSEEFVSEEAKKQPEEQQGQGKTLTLVQ